MEDIVMNTNTEKFLGLGTEQLNMNFRKFNGNILAQLGHIQNMRLKYIHDYLILEKI
jgi:hypothetical protein